MRRISTAVLLGLLVVAALGAPVSAVQPGPTGNRINLFAGDQDYPANTAFHVRHGFGLDQTATAVGKYEFKLKIDGVYQTADFFRVTPIDGGTISKLWYYDDPAGMTGTHDFVGEFYGPCGAGSGLDCDPGQQPNTVVLLLELDAQVTFTP